MDHAAVVHAAVCESRAGLGRCGGVHPSAHCAFQVTGWGVSDECRRCGEAIKGCDREQERHAESCRRGVAWATVDVPGQFEKIAGCDGGDESKCRHCGSVVRGRKLQLKRHLAACKSLPDSVRGVLDHAAVCESRAGLGLYGGVHAAVYRGFRVTGWGVNECRRCGKVIRGWGSQLKRHSKSCDRGVAVTWATVDVDGQFEHVNGRDSGDESVCRHCRNIVRGRGSLKQHLARCKALPDSVRGVMDRAAVCESRAGLGRYGGVHAAVYRGFRVTGWGVNECRRCGKVIRGWGRELKRHSEGRCDGVTVTWTTVDVCGQFEYVNGCGGNDGRVCRHCSSVVRGHDAHLKYHLARCKALPDSVRGVMDHAAVCESRAGLGCYGGVHAAVYRGFRVTGWGVNECRRCGRVVRGWQQALRKHTDHKACVASAAATQSTAAAAAASASTRHAHSTDLKRGRACVPPRTSDGSGAAVDGTIPRTISRSARATKRLRTGDAGSDNACNDCDSKRRANWRHQISVYGSGGGSSRSTVFGQPRRQAQQAEASRKGASQGAAMCSKAAHGGGAAAVGSCGTVNGGDAWAHGYTVTGSGLKVPLAPMPSRCKRARRVRASGGWTSGVCVGSGSGCSGTMGSDSGAMGV